MIGARTLAVALTFLPAMAWGQAATGGGTLPGDDAAARCDRLAAAPFDERSPVPGVPMENVDAGAAIEACLTAVAETPGEARFRFQLARAQQLNGQFGEAAAGYAEILAEVDYPAASNNLAVLHAAGLGVDFNAAEALRLFRSAADAGFAVALYNLADEYEQGVLVKTDLEEAVRLHTLAAEQGYAPAQYRLAVMYFEATGVPHDLDRARDLIEAAYASGYPDAAYSLGYLYEYGYGVDADRDRAIALYREAAEAGVPNAILALEDLAEE